MCFLSFLLKILPGKLVKYFTDFKIPFIPVSQMSKYEGKWLILVSIKTHSDFRDTNVIVKVSVLMKHNKSLANLSLIAS